MKDLDFRDLLISYGFTHTGSPYILEKGAHEILIAIHWYCLLKCGELKQKYTFDNLEPINKIERSIKLKMILKK